MTYCCRARQARSQHEIQCAALAAMKSLKNGAPWDPLLGSQSGIGATAFPDFNLHDFVTTTSKEAIYNSLGAQFDNPGQGLPTELL